MRHDIGAINVFIVFAAHGVPCSGLVSAEIIRQEAEPYRNADHFSELGFELKWRISTILLPVVGCSIRLTSSAAISFLREMFSSRKKAFPISSKETFSLNEGREAFSLRNSETSSHKEVFPLAKVDYFACKEVFPVSKEETISLNEGREAFSLRNSETSSRKGDREATSLTK